MRVGEFFNAKALAVTFNVMTMQPASAETAE
jgi:hypothetical protein